MQVRRARNRSASGPRGCRRGAAAAALAALLAALLTHQAAPAQPAAEPPDGNEGGGPAHGEEPRGDEPAPAAKPEGDAPEQGEAIDVYVQGERAEQQGGTTLTKTELRSMPGAFGDPFRTIEALPGVTPIVTGSPYFFVRGAPPGNVGYFFDGIRVPLLYHVGAGPSVIHPSLIKDLEFYAGSYPARYGRYSGGIVAANADEPAARWRGEASIRLFDAGAMLAAPLPPDGRGAVVVAGRYSYTAAILSLVAPDVELAYWDFQSLARYELGPNDEVSALAFGSYDFLGEDDGDEVTTVVDTEFYVLDLRWDHRFGPASSVRLATTLGLETTGGDAADLELLSHRLRQRAELDHRISADTRVRGGADVGVEHFSTRLHGIDPNGIENDEGDDWQRLFPTRSDLTTGAWVELDQKLDPRTTLQPGLRLDYYYSDFAHALGVDPRLALRVAILPEVRLVPTVGIAHQPPSFLVPIPGFAIAGLPGGLQRSVQSSFGVEADLPFDLSGRVTVFNHALFNLSDPIALVRSGEGDLSFDRRVIGSSKGLEIFLRRPISHRIGGFLSYTLSRTTRSLGRETFAAAFDRTHVFNAAVSFDLGRRWRAGTRFVFYTGFPAIELGDADQRPANPGRTFPFYRLDARLEKRWIIADHGFVALVFEWLNATLRPEVVDVQCTDSGHCQPVTIGPVTIPSIGVEGGFF